VHLHGPEFRRQVHLLADVGAQGTGRQFRHARQAVAYSDGFRAQRLAPGFLRHLRNLYAIAAEIRCLVYKTGCRAVILSCIFRVLA